MNLLDDLNFLLSAPSDLFYDLDEEPRILRPLVLNVLIFMLGVGISLLFNNTEEVLEAASLGLQFKLAVWIVAFLGLAFVLVVNGFQALFYFLGVKLFSYDLSYKTILSISLYSYIIQMIKKMLEENISLIMGGETAFSFSPSFLLANTSLDGSVISLFLEFVNPFVIWYILLVTIGISVVSGMSKAKAFGITIVSYFSLLVLAVIVVLIIG
ncbi:MAG: YIP1 family protein [Peptostreptococcaceae bacterium]|nr:YIP1 family protein [Peptostreptococcaceae bacterium]